jgi:dephospho-CoA kinase
VARLLAARGAVIIDSDQLAREVVEPGTPGLQQVVAAFGSSVLAADGTLDRPALGRKVFEDPSLRKTLEGIIHPLVRSLTVERAASAPPDAVVINDVPLLIEAGLAPAYEAIIVVFASEQTRIARLMSDRGMTREEALSRMAVQATDEQRHAAGGIEIYNDGTREELEAQVDRVWERLNRPD